MSKSKNEVTAIGTTGAFLKEGAWSAALLRVLNQAFEISSKPEIKATVPMAGGIMQHGYQCGMIWGAALAAGAQAHRLYGSGSVAESKSILAAQRLVESFRTNNDYINCLEITEIDRTSTAMDMIVYFLIKGGTIGCFKRAAKYAPLAFKEINETFSEENSEVSSYPVSCAAILAKKMGESEEHITMVSGLAGGIGLCGGACGVLGAGIWFCILKKTKNEDYKIDYKDPVALELINTFLKSTDYKFECSEIVGKKFKNIKDHSEFLQNGGCSEIIKILTSKISEL